MTRNGLIEQNAVTKEEKRISEREQDFDVRSKPQTSKNLMDGKSRTDEPKKQRAKQRKANQSRVFQNDVSNRSDISQNNSTQNEAPRNVKTNEKASQQTTDTQVHQPINHTFSELKNITFIHEDVGSDEQSFDEQPEVPLQKSPLKPSMQQHKSVSQRDVFETLRKPPITENNGRLLFSKQSKRSKKKTKQQSSYQQSIVDNKANIPNIGALENTIESHNYVDNSVNTIENEVASDIAKAEKSLKPKAKPTESILQEKPTKLQFDSEQKSEQPIEKAKPKLQHGIKYQQNFSEQEKQADKTLSEDVAPTEIAKTDSEQFANSDVKGSSQNEVKPPIQELNSAENQFAKAPKAKTTHSEKLRKKSSRLQFAKDEKTPTPSSTPADKKLSNLQQRAEKANAKLEKAREKLPSKKKPTLERTFDEQKGKVKRKLRFESEVLPQGTVKPITPAPVAAVKVGAEKATRLGTNKLRQKVYEVEHENVGIKAAHRGEQIAEGVYRGGKRVTHSAFRFIRDKPYRTVSRLEKKATKAEIKYAYQKALNDNPSLKSNVFSRYMQKRKIKQQYAKAARDAKKAGKAMKKTGDITIKATKALAGVIVRHPVASGIIALILLLVFFIFIMFSSFGGMMGGSLSSIIACSYTAEDSDIDNAELAYTEWETELQRTISKTESDRPGYDEYRYQVDNIGHNPYELMAYLSAMHFDFKFADIESELRQIFDEQYKLTFTEVTETRYRTVTKIDPDTGEEYEDSEPYDWYILNVKLTAKSFTDAIYSRMTAEQKELYSLYMQTKGNRQYIDSPFAFNWLPFVTSYYGYRVHPISGAVDYHKGIDIGVPIGTDVLSGQDGRVVTATYDSGYGYYVVIDDGKGLVSKYAHLNGILVSVGQEVKRGDVIAMSGNSGNSTGPHLHLEVIKDGQYLNPLYFAVTNDTGREIIFGNPGTPMGDGTYADLIAEAEKYLGYPYVWGGSSPSTSFDCSGYVSWVLNQSGVASFGRTTAQGLFNMTTPISLSDAQPGDLIFFTGTYSSPNPVTHVGIYVGNGMMIHCGDPIQYTSINTSYWQGHYYACGRIN